MRRASKAAIIGLVGLPVFGLFLFPVLYIDIHSYMSYLTESSQYQLRKISTDDFDDFEPDVTASSFPPAKENELQKYPQVMESIEYFEGKQDATDLTYVQAYCDSGECVTYFPVKKVESAEFEKMFHLERCSGLFEYDQNYYEVSCLLPYDPPSYYFDGYSYGFWMMLIGMPVIVIIWVFHRWHVQGEKITPERPSESSKK